MRRLSFLLFVLFLVGCASDTRLTIYTQPEGAYVVTKSGKTAGVAPLVLYYDVTDSAPVDKQGCLVVQGVTAQWASGAKVKQDSFKLCGNKGDAFSVTLNRPQDAPDLATDLDVAMKLKTQRILAEQAKAANKAATAQTISATNSISAPTNNASNPSADSYKDFMQYNRDLGKATRDSWKGY